MTPQLFLAFLLITIVLIVTLGPALTLVIATEATEDVRAALFTGFGTRSALRC